MPSSNERNRIVRQLLNQLRVDGIDRLTVLESFGFPTYDNDEDPEPGSVYINTTQNRLTRKISDDPLQVEGLSSGVDGADVNATFVTAESETTLPNNFTHSNLSGSRLHPARSHDNSRHSRNFAVEGDPQPPESHDNTDHLETYAVDGEPQPPEDHDNTAHIADFILVAERGEPNGVAELNADSVLKNSQFPDFAAVSVFVVEDSTERLAIPEEDITEGDIAIEQDINEAYIYLGGDPSLEDNWSRFTAAEGAITSVFGRTGDVTAEEGDYNYSLIGGTHGNSDHDVEYITGILTSDSGVEIDGNTTSITFGENLTVSSPSPGEVVVNSEGGDGGTASSSEIQAVARRTS